MRLIIAALLLSSLTVHAQELARVHHKQPTFTAADYTGYVTLVGAHLGDYFTTSEGLGMHPAMIEHTLPAFVVKSNGRLALYEFGSAALEIGIAAELCKHGHCVLGRLMSYGITSIGMYSIFHNINAIDTQLARQSKLKQE